jgi:hypothetical protein
MSQVLVIPPEVDGVESTLCALSYLIVTIMLVRVLYKKKNSERFFDNSTLTLCVIFMPTVIVGFLCKVYMTIFHFALERANNARIVFTYNLFDELLYNFILSVTLVLFLYTTFSIYSNQGLKLAGSINERENKVRIVNVTLIILIPTIVLVGTIWAITTLSIQYQILFDEQPYQIVYDLNFSTDMIFHLLCLLFGCAIILKVIFIYRAKYARITSDASRKSFAYIFKLCVSVTLIITIRSIFMSIESIVSRFIGNNERERDIFSFIFATFEDIMLNVVAWCVLLFLTFKKDEEIESYEEINETL